MRLAIQFYHQAPLRAVEVHDIRTQRVLAAELEPLELHAPQQLPRLAFGLGRLMSEIAGSRDLRSSPAEKTGMTS
jgi:hypothetical protein